MAKTGGGNDGGVGVSLRRSEGSGHSLSSREAGEAGANDDHARAPVAHAGARHEMKSALLQGLQRMMGHAFSSTIAGIRSAAPRRRTQR